MIRNSHRLVAILLSVILAFQIMPLNILAEGAAKETERLSDPETATVEEPGTADSPEDAPQPPAEEEQEHGTPPETDVDFPTKRLLVRVSDPAVITEEGEILATYGDGVYLLAYEDEARAKEAYADYLTTADFVEADVVISIGGKRGTAAGKSAVNEGADGAPYDIALIDTGAAEGAAKAVSVIGGDGVDVHGHGSAMLKAMGDVSDALSILSVKAFDDSGNAYLSDIYAAMRRAVDQGARVICLPFAFESKGDSAVLSHAVSLAKKADIAVVCAAGDKAANAADYLPGRMDGVYTAGACDEEGTKRPASNFGKTVLCSVVAASTDEAAAKLAAMLAIYGADGVKERIDNGVLSERKGAPAKPEKQPTPSGTATDENASYEEHLQLAVTKPSDDRLLEKKELEKETLAAIGSALAVAAEEPDPDRDWSIPPAQDPETLDNTTIEKIYVRWLSVSDGADSPAYFGRLELAPDGEKVTNQQFQIDFALSGQMPHAPGSIELVFPAYLWKDRYGEEPGILTLAIPEDGTEGAEFVWKRVEDKIVVTNVRELSAASKVMIQGTFRDVVAPDMRDDTTSILFNATVTVATPYGNSISKKSNDIDAHIDTFVKVNYANKTAYDKTNRKYDVWWESIPSGIPEELLPDQPEQYGYIRWYVSGSAIGSQPFKMYVSDSIPEDDPYGGIMLGVSDCAEGIVRSPDGKHVTALLYDGYDTTAKTAYVWTAYPKATFPEQSVTLPNTQTTSVVGWDDHLETKKEASDKVETKKPTIYTFVKYWDDHDDEHGKRPKSLTLKIYRQEYSNVTAWKSIKLTAERSEDGSGNYWTYRWSDEGQISTFRVDEEPHTWRGVLDDRYDGDGHQLEWRYNLTSTKYDSATHTWTYTNSYDEGWVKFDLSKLSKQVEWKYRDNSLQSLWDNLSLNKLLRGEEVPVRYDVEASISAAKQSVWYEILPNRFILEDVEYILNNNRQLTVNDVDVGAVELSVPTLYRYVNLNPDTGWYEREVVKTPLTTLYGMVGEQWVPLATMENDEVTAVRAGVTVSGKRVELPRGVSRVKLQLESDVAIVDMKYTVELRVKPTKKVLQMIEDNFEDNDYLCFPLYNKANAYAEYAGTEPKADDWTTYQPGDRIVSMEAPDTGYLHGRLFKVAADLSKSFVLTENQQENRRAKLHSDITLIQQSNVVTSFEYETALAQGEIPNSKSGVFYDLLPYGVDPDLSSIVVEYGSYSNARAIPNYRYSGRTLLIIPVQFEDHIGYYNPKNTAEKRHPEYPTYPTAGYYNAHTVSFDAYLSWDVIMDTGLKSVRNVTAYAADEDAVGSLFEWSGEPDDPAAGNHVLSPSAVGMDSDWMKGLGDGRTTPSFVYAGAPLIHEEFDMAALTELQKHVLIPGSGDTWVTGRKTNDVNVQEGGQYTYRLTINSDADTITKNIILLDPIEGYIPVAPDEDAGDTRWRGSLVSIDLTQIKAAGIAPEVYYSTMPDLEAAMANYNPSPATDTAVIEHLQNDLDSSGNHVWSKEAPEDLSKVTGIAIDMRFQEDGTPFELNKGGELMVYLHMRAPYDDVEDPPYFMGTDGRDHERNAHAYNNVYMDCVQRVIGEDEHAYIRNNYTKVGIYTQDIEVLKVWDDADDADGKRPDSITVHLFADGVDTKRSVTLSEQNNWTARFERLPTFNDEDKQIVYTCGEEFEGDEEYTMTPQFGFNDEGMLRITLINKHEREKINLPVSKTWLGDEDDLHGTRPKNIVVRLYANGTFTGKTLSITPDAEGNWSGEFTDLERYYDHGKEIVYTIEEEPIYDYIGEVDGYAITNRYHPYGDLIVTKTVQDITPKAAENTFTFTLLLEFDDGSEVINKYDYAIYDADGNPTGVTGKLGNGNEFSLKGGEKIVISDIDSGVIYRVIEKSKKGFTLTGTVNGSGEISSWAPAEAEFINKYSARGTAQLEVQKLLSGRKLAMNQFRFDLKDADGVVLKSAYSDLNGKATFGRITYTNADNGKVFTYYISEYEAGRPGYTYDKAVYRVTVEPVDNGDGTMECKVTYYDAEDRVVDVTVDGNNYTVPVFQNRYHAEGDLIFQAWKTLDGRELAAGEFRFDLYDGNFQPVTSGTTSMRTGNDADGVITFPKLAFDETHAGKTYWYYIHEAAGSDATVVYSHAIFGFEVTVVDNGDGTLSFDRNSYDVTEAFAVCATCNGTGGSQDAPCGDCGGLGGHGIPCGDCDGTGRAGEGLCETCRGSGLALTPSGQSETPVFYNELEDGAFSVSKYIGGEGADPNQKFKFHVKLIGEKVKDGVYEYEISAADAPEEGVFGAGTPEVTAGTATGSAHTAAAVSSAAAAARVRAANAASAAKAAVMPLADHGPLLEPDSEGLLGSATDGVRWAVYADGTIVFTPANGVEGTLEATDPPDYVSRWPWRKYRDSIVYTESSGLIHLEGSASFLFNESKVQSLSGLSSWDTSQTTNMRRAFSYCTELTDLSGLEAWDTGSVTTFNRMFWHCGPNLTNLDALSEWDTHSATTMQEMFYDCPGITSADFAATWNTGSVTTLQLMFSTTGLTDLDGLSEWDIHSATDIGGMFSHCTQLTNADGIRGWDVSSVTDIASMFAYCSSLPAVDLSMFANHELETIQDLFYDSPSLSQITIPSWRITGTGRYASTRLPTPPKPETTGLWISLSDVGNPNAKTYTSEQLDSAPGDTYVWQMRGPYTIQFLPGEGATGDMATVTSPTNSSYTLPANKFVRYGYEFTGWEDQYGTKYPLVNGVATIPANRYESNQIVQLTAQWAKIDTSFTIKDGEFDFTLRGGEKATFSDIPAGTAYQVWEETPDGWVLIKEVDASGVIRPLETANAKFYNLYSPGLTAAGISAIKYFDGRAAAADAFEFLLLDAEGNELQRVKTQAGGLIKFEQIIYDRSKLGTHRYTIREVPGSDAGIRYDGHSVEVTVSVSENADGTLHAEVTYGGGNAAFRNETIPGSLRISKVGRNLTEANRNASFKFRVRLYQPNGIPAEGRFAWYPEGKESEKQEAMASMGEIVVSCTAGQTIVIPDLTAGMRYEVEEFDLPFGWQLTDSKNTAGTIQANTAAQVTMTNAYSASTTVSLGAHKNLVGAPLEPGAFRFELLTADGQTVLDTAVNGAVDTVEEYWDDDAGKMVSNPWYGMALAKFAPLKFDGPGEYTYLIREQKGSDPTIVYDKHQEEVRILVEDNGDGTLRSTVQYGGSKGGAVFTNGVLPGSLTVAKTLQNATPAAAETEFRFRLSLKDSSGSELTDWYSVAKSDGTLGLVKHGGIVTIKGGQSFTITGLPNGALYEVTELDAPGFEIIDAQGTDGVIAGGEEASASFTNVYSAFGSMEPAAKKYFLGGEIGANMFAFNLLDSAGNVLQTAYADAEGNVAFAPVGYTEADDGKDFLYTIQEVAGEDKSIRYDSHFETLNVHVEDNGDGTMTVTVVYDEDGAVFVNDIAPGMLTVAKGLMNPTDAAVQVAFEFKLRLKDADGNALEGEFPVSKSDGTVETVADGGSVFIKSGEWFTVSDLPDGTWYEVEEQNKQGFELVASEGVSGLIAAGAEAKASFTNAYSASAAVQLTAQKRFIGGDLEANWFAFELLDAQGELLQTVYADGSGRIAFEPIAYTQDDAGKEFLYTIREVVGSDVNIAYDDHMEVVTVQVTDHGDGTMTVTAVYDEDGAVFTNVALAMLEIGKIVTGAEGDAEKDFSFTLTLADADGLPLQGALNYMGIGGKANGTLTLDEGGWAEFTLKHGESILIAGLPVGTTYAVKEVGAEEDGYIVAVKQMAAEDRAETTDRAEGVIAANGANKLIFINHKDSALPPEEGTAPATGEGSTMALWLAGMAMALLAQCTVLLLSRKRQKNRR